MGLSRMLSLLTALLGAAAVAASLAPPMLTGLPRISVSFDVFAGQSAYDKCDEALALLALAEPALAHLDIAGSTLAQATAEIDPRRCFADTFQVADFAAHGHFHLYRFIDAGIGDGFDPPRAVSPALVRRRVERFERLVEEQRRAQQAAWWSPRPASLMGEIIDLVQTYGALNSGRGLRYHLACDYAIRGEPRLTLYLIDKMVADWLRSIDRRDPGQRISLEQAMDRAARADGAVWRARIDACGLGMFVAEEEARRLRSWREHDVAIAD